MATKPNTTSDTPEVTLVLATMNYTDNTWIDKELGDLLAPHGHLNTAIYVVNDASAPLHTPANKGHEAMAYLTYLIDSYDSLPSISIFMHGHRTTWHNNDLLALSSASMIRFLRPEKVLKDGYMNLRCHWNPGCPDHLHPFATEYDEDKAEELLVKDAWMQVFQVDETEVPEILAQPCCSQFAVTAERIRQVPRERYIRFRDWLMSSDLDDYVTGRLFEYFWQYIFNQTSVLCPDPRICYCEGFGVCFENPAEYDLWLELRDELVMYQQHLNAWWGWQKDKTLEKIKRRGVDEEEEEEEKKTAYLAGTLDEKRGSYRRRDDASSHGEGEEKLSRGDELVLKISEINQELQRRVEVALTMGRDPGKRNAAIEAARMHHLPLLPRDGPSYPTKKNP